MSASALPSGVRLPTIQSGTKLSDIDMLPLPDVEWAMPEPPPGTGTASSKRTETAPAKVMEHSSTAPPGTGTPMMSPTAATLTGEQPPAHFSFTAASDYGLVWSIGLSSGLMNGLFAVGGPPLMIFIAYYNIEKNESRATVSLAFLVCNLVRMLYIFAFQDVVSVFSVQYYGMAAIIGVVSMAAVLAGNWIADRIDQKGFRMVLLLVLVAGASILMAAGASVGTKSVISVLSLGCMGCMGYMAHEWEKRRLQTHQVALDDMATAALQETGQAAQVQGAEGQLLSVAYKQLGVSPATGNPLHRQQQQQEPQQYQHSTSYPFGGQ